MAVVAATDGQQPPPLQWLTKTGGTGAQRGLGAVGHL